jgi:hypothetical protein
VKLDPRNAGPCTCLGSWMPRPPLWVRKHARPNWTSSRGICSSPSSDFRTKAADFSASCLPRAKGTVRRRKTTRQAPRQARSSRNFARELSSSANRPRRNSNSSSFLIIVLATKDSWPIGTPSTSAPQEAGTRGTPTKVSRGTTSSFGRKSLDFSALTVNPIRRNYPLDRSRASCSLPSGPQRAPSSRYHS